MKQVEVSDTSQNATEMGDKPGIESDETTLHALSEKKRNKRDPDGKEFRDHTPNSGVARKEVAVAVNTCDEPETSKRVKENPPQGLVVIGERQVSYRFDILRPPLKPPDLDPSVMAVPERKPPDWNVNLKEGGSLAIATVPLPMIKALPPELPVLR